MSFGRGGRGTALLEALNISVRRPGQSESPDDGGASSSTQNVSNEPPKSFGRGQFLEYILNQCEDSPSVSTGRGVQSYATSSECSAESQKKPLGRGMRSFMAMMNALKPPAKNSSENLEKEMKKMSIESSNIAEPHSTVEDNFFKSSNQKASTSSEKEMKQMSYESLDIKKTHGTVGTKISFGTNFVWIKFQQDRGIFEYHVNFDPPVDGPNLRFLFINQCKHIIGDAKVFDGTKLILPHKLPDEITIIPVEMYDNKKVNVIIKFIGRKKVNDSIQFLNIVFRRMMNILQFKRIGKDSYNPKGAVAIPQHKLEIWPGYVTAVQEFEGGLMMCIDVSHRVMRTQTVWEVLRDLSLRYPNNFRESVNQTLIGTTVLTRYNNRTHRIDDIDWNMNPQSTFITSAGEQMTFVDYYKNNYNLQIHDYGQPLLVHRAKRKELELQDTTKLICLIPELSFLTGISEDMKSDFRIMKDVASHTRLNPNQRIVSLRKYLHVINSSEECLELLNKWGITIDSDILSANGRILPSETIYLNGSQFKVNQEADWSRDLSQGTVISAVPLDNWVIVFTNRERIKTFEFIKILKQVGGKIGIKINEPRICEIGDDKTETFLRTIRNSVNPKVQLVVIISPSIREDRYSAIKRLCCCDKPVASQVINVKTISQQNKLRSVTMKIAMQINCKLGGQLWALGIPKESMMVIGIDVYHDKKKHSVGAFVASMNNTLTRWYSRACIQSQHQELIDTLKPCLVIALRKYHEVNHFLPQQIVVFRDGVGDSQLHMVSEYEADQLHDCFSSFGENYHPRLTIIVVQKRINTRFFIKENSENWNNPCPGSIVDQTISKKNRYDFYLVSQHVRQGTVSPTHYVVVHDTSHDSPDFMQRLSYQLTHLYYNWAGTVRVPAPCQYAHKLAYLVGQNLQKNVHPDLSDRLYYL